MFAKAEDPYSNMMVALLSEMRRLVYERANLTPHVGQRFYLDALVAVLGKTREHIPNFFPSVDTKEKERIVRSFMVNYDLIHIDHEAAVSMRTGLKTDAALTADAITRFYEGNARYRLGNARSPLTGVKASENMTDPGTAAPVLARLYRENIRCPQRDTQSPHAIVLYKKVLHHYNFTNPDAPTFTPIAIDFNNRTEAGQNRQKAYKSLMDKLVSLPTDHIYRAEREREWMETLLVNVPKDRTWRHINLRLVMEFLAKFEPILNKIAQDWADTKKGMLWLAIMAVLLMGGLYLLGVLLSWAKIVVLVQFAMLPVLAAGVFGLGIAAYCYVQEKFYQKMLADFTQIDYEKTYPAGNLQPEQSFSVKKSLATFFKDHQAILAPAFPAPAHHV
ncbi:MAG: hypothetical protein KBB94_03890 [Legionellaceae bacterium]|nr:hypothetical protein [Legionellaceae bacterium]MBP9774217.1 hypothetical protein [Legionellaceae bacterium]